jgi:hypothetical protein
MKININDIINTTIDNFDGNYGYDHKLLAYFGKQFNNEILAEIGTRTGEGALSLSQNINNKIITYDIMNWNRSQLIKNKPNIHFIIKNIINPTGIKEILDCPFIYLDVDPHTGEQEERFVRLLEENNYNGIVMLDDIFDMFPMLQKWYHNLQTTAVKYYLPKYDERLYRWAILDFTHELEII